MTIEDLHQPGEIEQRSTQPVNLIDDDTINPSRFDVGEQLPESGAVERGAGETTVIITRG
jgi:hypothetical protein